MGFRFGLRRRRPLTARMAILIAGLFIFATFRSVNRGLAQAAQWQGVVESKEMAYNWEELSFYRYSSTGFGKRPYVTVRCEDGKIRKCQVFEATWPLVQPGDRVVKSSGEKYARKVR